MRSNLYNESYYARQVARRDALGALADTCEILFSWDDGEGAYALLDIPSFIAEDEDTLFEVLWDIGVAPRRVIWDYEHVSGTVWRIFLER